MAIDYFHAVWKAPERLKQVRIRFVAAKAKTRCNVQRHLMPAVRYATRTRPAMLMKHIQRAEIFDQSIAQRTIELQIIAIGAHAAITNQVTRILH